jgi:flagellar biosynthesis protein FlhB
MNDDQNSTDKPFEPTQKKLDDARLRGEFAKSADLTTAAAYGGFLVICLAFGSVATLRFADAMIVLLDQPAEMAAVIFEGGGMALAGGIIGAAGWPLIPWFLGPALLALLAIIAQRAFVFTPSKVAPKWNRISPLAGIKNKFGRQGLFEFFKSAAKLTIYATIMSVYLVAQIDAIIGAVHLPPALIAAEIARMIVALAGIVFVVAITLGGLDYLWQLGEHLRQNRMSRQELMEELKQAEGDPQMKQQRRQRGQELAMNKMLADLPNASVVIVNPTHYAVALQWDRQSAGAPVCIAKGVDEIAAKIREIALANAIPLHSDPPTARALFASTDLGQQIAPDHYQAVAAAIRFAETIRQKARPV